MTVPQAKIPFMVALPRGVLALLAGGLLITGAPTSAPAADPLTAENGFTQTPGGRGGRIVRVTNLKKSGRGSLAAALAERERRIIVFEIAGVIDLEGASLNVREPCVTVAGQTAPAPGITLIRGGLTIATHDVILQHLRVRPGEAGHAKGSGWETDGIATVGGAYDVIVDHCSCTWATDENLSASGPRFAGDDAAAWREGTSHRITFSNCLIAEGLSRSTHGKGEHSKGSLIHDNASDIAIFGNLYANNVERNPLFKGGVRGVLVNNLIVNPGRRSVHFALIADEWGTHAPANGQLAIIGNVMRAGVDTIPQAALMVYSRGPLELHLSDNRAEARDGQPLPLYRSLASPGAGPGCTLTNQPPLWPVKLKPLPSERVREIVLTNAGAQPWARDAIDQRIVDQARAGTGRVINSESEVGGYPNLKPVRVRFVPSEWDLQTMQRRNSASRGGDQTH